MSNVIARTAAGALLAGAVFFTAAAQGAIYQGRFDPVEFQGIASFDIPGSCVTDTGFVDAGSSGCGIVDFLSAHVTNHDAPPVTGTIDFGPQGDVATQLQWFGGLLIGIETDLIGPASGTGTFNDPNGYLLQFHVGDIFCTSCDFRLEASGPSTEGLTSTPGTVVLFACGFGCDGKEQVGDPAIQQPFVRVSVPEPGSLALLGSALVAGWASRRRLRR
ncbi:MAG TPA: PEP-CTERM sorting domain-containing protein [Casimicrobiaceae bacterium]|jgi:PEP-CTERM motif|nr:PEP-CTERM sorting domain-containing protein [Casimicrobiaceae bacterium]